MWGVFVDVDGHKRGQTPRSIAGNKIQTNSNFKAHMYYNSYVLDFSVAAASFSVSHSRITLWCSIIVIPSCSVISIASYTKIFRTLRHNQVQVQDHVQSNALNMVRYRKAVSSALWVQLALAVCYVPKFTTLAVVTYRKTYPLHVVVIDAITTILTYFNSTLNPFLYCWKIKEVRQAVKQTIRRALCFPWT